MKRQQLLAGVSAVALFILAMALLVIGIGGVQTDITMASAAESVPTRGISPFSAGATSGGTSALSQGAMSSAPPPHRGGEWQCWDDGSLDPCHRNLEQIQALADNDIWIAAGGSNSAGILHYDGVEWQEMDIPPTPIYGGDLKALQMLSPTDGWAVGLASPWHWDGTDWRETVLDTSGFDVVWPEAVDIVSADDAWAVGRARKPDWTYVGAVSHWSGQTWQTSSVPDRLYGVGMVSPDNGWAVGAGGSIYHWNGTAWNGATSPVGNDLHGVVTFAGDPNNAWAVGDGGAILRYDGGDWSAVASPTGANLKSIAMDSLTYGWAVGSGGAILHYDGSWSTSSSPTGADLSSVTIVSTTSVYAVSSNGGLYHWDGGNWGTLFGEPDRRALMDVAMLATNDGWVAGEDGRLAHWDGSTWNAVTNPTGGTLNALDFLTTDDGWAVGSDGTILNYNGANWSTVISPVGDYLYGIDVISPTEGWAVGDGGRILRYNGAGWNVFPSPSGHRLRDVQMVGENDGWAVGGGYGGSGYTSAVLRWNGSAWDFDPSAPDDLGFYSDIAILSPDDVYLAALFGLAHWDGSSWSSTDPKVGEPASIDMYSVDEGWATGWTGVVSHWDGSSWETVFNRVHTIADVDTVTSDEAWAVCGEWTGGAILHYTAPEPVVGTLSPGDSLTQAYTGHETHITLGENTPGALMDAAASDTVTISYKLRQNDQGEMTGIDHFFDLTADRPDLTLTVTARFSDTQSFGPFSIDTLGLYRLENGTWVTDGVTLVGTQADELEAVVTEMGSFGVMGRPVRVFLPLTLRNDQ